MIDVIATRSLYLDDDQEVVVEIGRPQRESDPGDFRCGVRIIGIGDGKVREVHGVDSVQALELALQFLGASLYTSSEFRGGRLRRWLSEPGRNLGFPVPSNIQDVVPDD